MVMRRVESPLFRERPFIEGPLGVGRMMTPEVAALSGAAFH